MTDYVMLVKLRLSVVVVFSSMLGYLIAAGDKFDMLVLLLLALGGFLVTASANTLNQVLERDYDVLMTRTSERPLAAGRMKTSEAVLFAGITCLLGTGILAVINPLAATLGMVSLVLYSFIYTPLKRYSTLAVAVGAIPGALPVLIGFAAFEHKITFLAFAIFVIQFLWQFPHFWSIGFLSFDEYKKAGFKLLPEIDGEIDRSVGRVSAFYSLLIFPVVTVLYSLEAASVYSSLIVAVFTFVYFLLCVRLDRNFDRNSALKLMLYSFIYLPVILMTYWLL
jgi:protoheme IX farnesyltransferase